MGDEFWQLFIVLVAGAITYVDTQILIPRRDRKRLEEQRRQMYVRIMKKIREGSVWRS